MEKHSKKGYDHVDGIETLDWILDREKQRGLLEVAQIVSEPLRW